MLAGLAAGLALAGFASGPVLRKSGAFSLPDLFGARFESAAMRSASAVVVAGACGVLGLAAIGCLQFAFQQGATGPVSVASSQFAAVAVILFQLVRFGGGKVEAAPPAEV